MRFENIVKRLEKDNKIYAEKFLTVECIFCNGTALVDIVDGNVVNTTATLQEVKRQIKDNHSHIMDVAGKRKELTKNMKLGY